MEWAPSKFTAHIQGGLKVTVFENFEQHKTSICMINSTQSVQNFVLVSLKKLGVNQLLAILQ